MLMQMPGPRDIVIYWPGPREFSVVQKPWGWAYISVQKPREGMVTGQIDTYINTYETEHFSNRTAEGMCQSTMCTPCPSMHIPQQVNERNLRAVVNVFRERRKHQILKLSQNISVYTNTDLSKTDNF